VCLSTGRDGRETLPATVRHDGDEDAPRSALELAAGIGRIQPAIPRLCQELSSCMQEFQDFFHGCQCDVTTPQKLRTVVQKSDGGFDGIAQDASRCVQFVLR
jgi:hypothetical protein